MNPVIGQKERCVGCGLCAIVCPQKIITIESSAEGFFLSRYTDKKSCSACNLCSIVCPAAVKFKPSNQELTKCLIAHSRNTENRKICSSGGVAYELMRLCRDSGFAVCGVRYCAESGRAEHFWPKSEAEMLETVGSKYLQSYTPDALLRLNKTDKFFISGTPCQIDAVNKYATWHNCRDNFILMDFSCHGVPSYNLWNKYLALHRRKLGKICSAKWRNKKNGWHKSYCIHLTGANDEIFSSRSDGDLFYRFFLGNFCLNRPCYSHCQYKHLNSAADFRVGDLWGSAATNDDLGTSFITVFTSRGNELLLPLEEKCVLSSISLDAAFAGQMSRPIAIRWTDNLALRMLQSILPLPAIWRLTRVLDIFNRRILKKIIRNRSHS